MNVQRCGKGMVPCQVDLQVPKLYQIENSVVKPGRRHLIKKGWGHGVRHQAPLMLKFIVGLHKNKGLREDAFQNLAEEKRSVEFSAVREYVMALPPVGEEDNGASKRTNEKLHNRRVQLKALTRKPIRYCLVGLEMLEHGWNVSQQIVCGRLAIGDARDRPGESSTVGKIEEGRSDEGQKAPDESVISHSEK